MTRILAEEIAGAERRKLLTFSGHLRVAVDEDVERVAAGAIAGQADAFAAGLLVETRRELAELFLVQRREERDGLQLGGSDHVAEHTEPRRRSHRH
jgi:hypothetical protein